MAPETPSSKVTWTTTWAQTSRSRCTTSPDSCTPATSCSDRLGKNGVGEARKRLPFRSGAGVAACSTAAASAIREPAPPRRRCGLFTHVYKRLLRANRLRTPTSEQAPPVRYETIALPRRNIRRATPISMSSRGNLQRIPQGNSTRTAAQAQAWFLSGAKTSPSSAGAWPPMATEPIRSAAHQTPTASAARTAEHSRGLRQWLSPAAF